MTSTPYMYELPFNLSNSSMASNATSGPAPNPCWPVLIDPTTAELLQTMGGDPSFLALISTMIALTVFTVGIYFETLWFLCRKIPSRRKIQLSFVMGIYPIFSLCSLLSMFTPRASIITGFTAHVYFSMALVQFIMLMTGYYGQKVEMLQKLEGEMISLATPPLTIFCACFLPKIPVNKYTLPKFVKVIRAFVLQIAIIKPLFYFLGAVLWLDGTFVPGDFSKSGVYLWFNVIYIVSTLFALNGIIIFYRLSRVPLAEYRLTPKFLTVQLTLIFTNIQPFTIGLCALNGHFACKPPFHPGMRAMYLDSMLNIIEMFLFNLFATTCFRRLRGNMNEEQYVERLQYSRLSKTSFSRGDSVTQRMATQDENENKVPPESKSAFQKQNGGAAMDNPWSRGYGHEQGTPFLVSQDANRSGMSNGTNKQAEDERSSNRSGSLQNLVTSGSGSDRETIV